MDINFAGPAQAVQVALAQNIGILCPDGFALAHCDTQGYDLFVKASNPTNKAIALENLLAIATLADGIVPLRAIAVEGSSPKSMETLKRLFPVTAGRSDGACRDLALQATQDRGLSELVKVYIDCLEVGQSFFVLGEGAVYHQSTLSTQADPPCTAEDMVGKPVGMILGDEAHERLSDAIQLVLATGERSFLLYPGVVMGELRQYTARITPLPDHGKALFVVDRIG